MSYKTEKCPKKFGLSTDHVLEVHPDIVDLGNLLSDGLGFLRLLSLKAFCLVLQGLQLRTQ